MKALVFGTTSDIGQAIITELESLGYCPVIHVSRNIIDFADPTSDQKVKTLLDVVNPDVIVNSVGVFEGNNTTHHNAMNVNFGSCWSIVKYYINNKQQNVKIIFIGSSAYKKGRKDYMVYSASKAALYNLWEGATDFFKGTGISINLINPVRVNTKMIKDLFDPKMDYLEPIDVAKEVVKVIRNEYPTEHNSVCIDMKYKDIK